MSSECQLMQSNFYNISHQLQQVQQGLEIRSLMGKLHMSMPQDFHLHSSCCDMRAGSNQRNVSKYCEFTADYESWLYHVEYKTIRLLLAALYEKRP